MRFMILINSDENAEKQATEADRKETWGRYMKYSQELKSAGVMLAGDALAKSEKGARVRVDGGKRTVTDGPFTEAKEVIGGYYLIQVKSKDEAVEWAARCPGASGGGVEVREVVDM